MNLILTPSALLSPHEHSVVIGQRAKKRRKYLKLSRATLASMSGVSVPTIERFESKGIATLHVILKLAYALGSNKDFEIIFTHTEYRSIDEFLKADEG